MKLFSIVFLLNICMLFANNLIAQSTKKSPIYFTSNIGKPFVNKDLGMNIKGGFKAMSGVEYKINNRHSLSAEANFDNYDYEKTAINYSINGSINVLALALNYKYFITNAKLQPYIKLGAGFGNFTVPTTSVTLGFAKIFNDNFWLVQFKGALGLKYNLNQQYKLFLELEHQQFGQSNLLPSPKFTNTSLQIGIITAL